MDNKPTFLPDNRITIFNGQEVRWSIGDINFDRAYNLGCTSPTNKSIEIISGRGGQYISSDKGAYWEAWGYCNGKQYQLAAWFCRATRMLYDIEVLGPKQTIHHADGSVTQEDAYYYDEETYKLLTTPQKEK